MPKRGRSKRLSSARLRHLANMRAAKAQKRLERVAAGWRPEPKMERYYQLEIGFRDKRSGAIRLVGFMLREWKPTPGRWRAVGGQRT